MKPRVSLRLKQSGYHKLKVNVRILLPPVKSLEMSSVGLQKGIHSGTQLEAVTATIADCQAVGPLFTGPGFSLAISASGRTHPHFSTSR